MNKSPQKNIIEEDSKENLNDENKGNNESDLTIDIVEVIIFFQYNEIRYNYIICQQISLAAPNRLILCIIMHFRRF